MKTAFRPVLAMLVLACACTDSPVSPSSAPEPSFLSAGYECTADFRAGTLECGPISPTGESGARMNLMLYESAAKVINAGGGAYSGGDKSNPDTMTYNLALRNLIPQPIGTTDGVTSDTSRLVITAFRLTSPQTTATAQLDNADGTATFVDSLNGGSPITFSNASYVNYPGLLTQNTNSSPKLIRLVFSPSVTRLTFTYRIWTRVQYPHGYLTIGPADSMLGAGQTLALTASAFTALGAPLSGETVTWQSSDAAVAQVDPSTGVVTGVGGGTAIITATSTVDARRTAARSIAVIQANNDLFGQVITGMINTANTSPPFSVTANDQLSPSTIISFAGWNAVPGKTQQGGDVVMVTSGAGRGHFMYDPPAGYAGVDSLEYTIQSGSAVSTAKVALPVDVALAVTGTTPAGGATEVAAGASIVIAFNEAVSVWGSSFRLNCDANAQSFTLSGSGTEVVTLNPVGMLPPQGSCTVTVVAAQVIAGDVFGPSYHLPADHVFSFTVASEFGGEF